MGLLVGKGPALPVGLLGILAAGSAVLPLDPVLPEERLVFMLRDCRARIVITESRYRERAEILARSAGCVAHVIELDTDLGTCPDGEDVCSDRFAEAVGDPDDLCYVIYTSGSTGTPKGVAVTCRNLSPLLEWSRSYFSIDTGTRVLQNLNHAFDFGMWELLSTLCFGGTLCFAASADREILEFAEAIRRHQATTLHTTPAFFAELLAVAPDLSSLTTVHLGGEEVTGALVASANRLLPPGATIHNGYGPTEATVNCAIYEIDRDQDGCAGAKVPIGWASANNQLCVVDERLTPVPEGASGELVVAGDGVALGYLGRPGLTASRFVPDAIHGGGGRLYRTGDLVRRRLDGALEFLGRMDRQVKLRGYRIELGEVESILARHPEVTAAAADLRVHGGHQRLVGYVLRGPSASLDTERVAEEVRVLAQRVLPGYMVPGTIVVVDRLPQTPNGKLDRGALPDPEDVRRRPSDADRRRPRRSSDDAMLRLYRAELARLWSQALDLDHVDAEANFFDLGGDSLLAARIVAHAHLDDPGLWAGLSSRVILEYQTIEEVAAALIDGGRSSDDAVEDSL
ncbi:non-ribosomal peptide synthetase [Microbispora sp. H10670]|uniref:non-ribosomal peptide synthetase n=1 Tax=Microbispora sp. H10670 TaxID=2729108 RepID=UPI0016004103|nr:non-ribosomal peptide synthetase [Microbispora sp. H10670]